MRHRSTRTGGTDLGSPHRRSDRSAWNESTPGYAGRRPVSAGCSLGSGTARRVTGHETLGVAASVAVTVLPRDAWREVLGVRVGTIRSQPDIEIVRSGAVRC